jgi:CheY-like chemotaxis protein
MSTTDQEFGRSNADFQQTIDAPFLATAKALCSLGPAEFPIALETRPKGTYILRPILVVEDEPLHRELLVHAVIGAGFDAHIAKNGEEGWEALGRIKYALVITDHEMPRLTGLELIERLREVSQTPPCILISGCLPAPGNLLVKSVRPGAVLSKPFTVAQLIRTISRLLRLPLPTQLTALG